MADPKEKSLIGAVPVPCARFGPIRPSGERPQTCEPAPSGRPQGGPNSGDHRAGQAW